MTEERDRTEELGPGHEPAAVRERLATGPRPSYLRDFVFGAVDGAVTTFAVVASAEGAKLSPGVVVVLGVANLLGDGFSMAAGNYLGVRSERELRERTRAIELEHVRHVPEGEREEVRQIFARKGFQGDQLETIVTAITSNLEAWVETMLAEEHGLPANTTSPHRAAATTFVAFVVVGSVPLLAFLPPILAPGWLEPGDVFPWSAYLTAATFFSVGAIKGRFVDRSWWRAGLETLLVGGAAAGIAFTVGAGLRNWLSG